MLQLPMTFPLRKAISLRRIRIIGQIPQAQFSAQREKTGLALGLSEF